MLYFTGAQQETEACEPTAAPEKDTESRTEREHKDSEVLHNNYGRGSEHGDADGDVLVKAADGEEVHSC